MEEEEDGGWRRRTEEGDRALCEEEKGCNAEPDLGGTFGNFDDSETMLETTCDSLNSEAKDNPPEFCALCASANVVCVCV